MTMLVERRAAGRERKLSSLEEEFKHWEADSGDKGDLRLHHSQIGRILQVLRPLRDEVASPAAGSVAAALNDREIETTALELHRMWEFFRSKLAMRKVRWMREYLDAVDDFAWASYKPARDAAERAGRIAAGQMKEPPLLFFGGGWSPFAMSRDYAFEAESVPDEPVRTEAFRRALKKLPVSVVGLPWFQVSHLPDAPVIGHEVGHLVEDDFGLKDRIRDTVTAAAVAGRGNAWGAWAGEIFGDFYGQLVTGPAFVTALAEALADEPKWIVRETVTAPKWGKYPPTYLRMRFNFALLRALGYGSDADGLHNEWNAAYGNTHAMSLYDADVDAIATALRDMKVDAFGGATIPQVISFDALRNETATALARLEAGAAPPPGNVRGLIAAARLMFDRAPDAYTEDVQKMVLETIAASLPEGVRGEVPDATDGTLTGELIGLLARREPRV